MKRFLLIVMVATFFIPVSARTMKEVFTEMPDSIIPYLVKNRRLDCIDFIENNMKAVVDNGLGGNCELITLTDSTLEMRLNGISTLYMQLLQLPIVDPMTNIVADVECILFQKVISEPVKQTFPRLFRGDWTEIPATEETDYLWQKVQKYLISPTFDEMKNMKFFKDEMNIY